MLVEREVKERGEAGTGGNPTEKQGPSAYYVVFRGERNGALLEPLRVALGPLGDALVVFTLERAAKRRLPTLSPGAGWRVRETSGGELVSLLSSLCGGVEYVLLDPRPEEGLLAFGGSAVLTSKHEFVDRCLGVGASAAVPAGSEAGVRGSPRRTRKAPGGRGAWSGLLAARGGALR